MLVNELAKAVGVEAHVVRYYARIGLLRPSRNPENNYQLFSHADLERLDRIQIFQDLGFSLSEIRGLLDQDMARSEHRRAQLIAGLRRNVARNRRQMAELSARQQRMEAALAEWTSGDSQTFPTGHGPPPKGTRRGNTRPP